MTNKSISITCNSDDTVALNAFSNALREMAQAGELHYKVSVDTTEAVAAIDELNRLPSATELAKKGTTTVDHVRPYPTNQYIKMVHPDHNAARYAKSDAEQEQMAAEGWLIEHDTQDEPTASDLDSDGLPWDARIHSTNKARNADDTWRLRRKPKDMTDEQWQEEIKTVQEELEYLMAIDPTVEEEEGEFIITSRIPVGGPIPVPGVGCAVSQGYVVTVEPVAEPVTIAPPVIVDPDDIPDFTIAPPVLVPPVTPPPVSAPVEAMTFPKLMSFLTERFGKITVEQVNELVAKHGLTNIQQFAQRPDLIGAFVADVKTLLGE